MSMINLIKLSVIIEASSTDVATEQQSSTQQNKRKWKF